MNVNRTVYENCNLSQLYNRNVPTRNNKNVTAANTADNAYGDNVVSVMGPGNRAVLYTSMYKVGLDKRNSGPNIKIENPEEVEDKKS